MTSLAATTPASRSLLGPVGEITECRASPEGVTDLWASSGLYLKPVAKVSITVSIPFVKGKEGSRVVSNSEVMMNIKKLVTPREFKNLKILKETNTFLRYLGEIEEKKDLAIFVSKLNGSFIQLKSFGSDAVFKLNAAEYDIVVPKQNDWVSHFSKMIGSNEDKPGLRPDTIFLTGIPCAWFSNYHRDKLRAIKEFERKREKVRKKRMMRNRRRQRGSHVSSSDQSEGNFASSSTDSDEEEAMKKREQQKKILLQFQSGEYKNTEEGKDFLHTKYEVHKIYRVDKSKSESKSKRKKRRRKSQSGSGSRSGSESRSSSGSRSRSSGSGSRSGSSSRSRSRSEERKASVTKKSTVASVNKAKQDQMQWKKNTFTSIGGEDAENEKENVGQETSEKEKESAPVAEDDETRQKRLNAEAKKKARQEFRRRPWLNLPVPDKPEESIVRRVFELFGVVRRLEIPVLKQLDSNKSGFRKEKRDSHGIGVFNFENFEAQCDAADVTTFKTFEVYIQYETYLGFTVSMNALRGKRLYYKDIDGRTYINTFKVDFDGTGYLSERKIQQRKLERFKHLHRDEIFNDKEQRDKIAKYENRLGGKGSQINSYGQEFSSRTKVAHRPKSSSRVMDGVKSRSRKSKSRKRRSEDRVESQPKKERREKVVIAMPKTLPRSVLYEVSLSRTRIPKSLSSVMGPALPEEPKPPAEERQVVMARPGEPKPPKPKISILSDLDDISSEEDAPGLQTNTEIDRLLKEALKVRSTRRRRLVVLELLRRLQLAKEARVQLVAKRKAQAVILVHAVFERIKNVETVILDRRVEAVEEVRLKQIEEERIFKEELARKEALRALRHKQKMHSKEVNMREKIVKRAMRKKDMEDLTKREQLRKQIASQAAASGATGGPDNPVLKSTAMREARHSVRRHGFKPDKLGQEVDKAVGYTAPENYSHYVEYMKEKRPNFVGSAVVSKFVPEETPNRVGPVKSQVIVPSQCPVPKPLEEIIQSKQFETDSESSCDDEQPTLLNSHVVTKTLPRRRAPIDLDDDSLYKVDGNISENKIENTSLKSNDRANRKFTDADFKVPDVPLAYMENRSNPVKKPPNRKWKKPESAGTQKQGSKSGSETESDSSSEEESSNPASSEEEEDFDEVTPRILDGKSPPSANKPKLPQNKSTRRNNTGSGSLESQYSLVEQREKNSEMQVQNDVLTPGVSSSIDTGTVRVKSNVSPSKRRNAVADSIMGSAIKKSRNKATTDLTAPQEDSVTDSLSEGEISTEDKEGRLNTSSEEDNNSSTESGETSSGSESEANEELESKLESSKNSAEGSQDDSTTNIVNEEMEKNSNCDDDTNSHPIITDTTTETFPVDGNGSNSMEDIPVLPQEEKVKFPQNHSVSEDENETVQPKIGDDVAESSRIETSTDVKTLVVEPAEGVAVNLSDSEDAEDTDEESEVDSSSGSAESEGRSSDSDASGEEKSKPDEN